MYVCVLLLWYRYLVVRLLGTLFQLGLVSSRLISFLFGRVSPLIVEPHAWLVRLVGRLTNFTCSIISSAPGGARLKWLFGPCDVIILAPWCSVSNLWQLQKGFDPNCHQRLANPNHQHKHWELPLVQSYVGISSQTLSAMGWEPLPWIRSSKPWPNSCTAGDSWP